jgi:hypothetical protein
MFTDEQGFLRRTQEEIADLQHTIADCQARLARLVSTEVASKVRLGEQIDTKKVVEDFNKAWAGYQEVMKLVKDPKRTQENA